MKKSSIYFFVFVILIILTILACGSSTSDKLQEASEENTQNESTEIVEENDLENNQQAEATSEITESESLSEPTEEVVESTSEPTDIPPTSTPEPEPISVTDFGYGQDGRTVGYSFLVENPNESLVFEDSQYQVAAFDEAGAIVETDSGYISVLLPDQVLGIGGSLFIDEGVEVDSIEVQLNAGDSQFTDAIPNFEVDSPIYYGGDFSSHVAGLITSPYNRNFSNIKVSAVVYNEEDEIIGGGYTYVNFILAENSTGTSVPVDSAGDVIRVDLYPSFSGLSLFGSENEIPEGATSIKLVKDGFGQDDRNVGYGLLVENPNIDYSIEDAQYRITAYAEDGTVIDDEEGYIHLLLPGQTLGIGGEIFVEEAQIVSRIETQLLDGDFIETTEPIPQFSTDNLTFNQGSFSSEVTGFIVSPYSQDITNLRVFAIAFDNDNNIIGGGSTFLDFAAANSNTAVEVNINTSDIPASVELYAVPSNLSEFE